MTQELQQQQLEANRYIGDAQDFHLFEDYSDEQDRQEITVKSVKKYENDFLESSYHKNSPFMRTQTRQNKFFSLSTPGENKKQFQDAFETKRRKNSQIKQDDETVQNVIVIRSSRKHKRQPDRYIRVPIISQQVKIIQLIPESFKKNTQTQRLQTNSSRQNSHRSHSSKQPRNHDSIHKFYEQEYLQTRLYSNHQDERERKMKTRSGDEWDHNHHECFGCKYCQVIKDMESFRLQRAQQTMKFHSFI